MKKILCLILSLAMLVSISAGVSLTASADTSGDFEYTVLDDGTAMITGYTGSDSVLEIPSELDGYTVTIIGMYVFGYCTNLTEVTIPDSVTKIEDWAFEFSTGLTNVTIGNGVTSIGESIFDGCTSLTAINVDENNMAYSSQDGVLFNKDKTELIQYPAGNGRTSYTIPDSVTSIGNSAFEDCTGLTEVIIPDSVTSIGGSAFYYCTSLAKIIIPDSVTSIGVSAFYGTAYYNDESNWEDDVLYIDEYLIAADEDISGAHEVKQGTKLIAESVFAYCFSLTEVTIPDSVTSIGEYAFYNCTRLAKITIPGSVKSIEDYTFTWCESLTEITIPDSVTSIGRAAFYGCSGLTNVTIGNSVTSIGISAFFRCTSLTEITIPDSVTSIGGSAFYYCTSLAKITIPDSVSYIAETAFYGCNSLTIYGYEGSYAQTYANENDIPFVALTSLTDETTGVVVMEKAENVLPDDTQLVVELISSSENSVIYDITLQQNGEEIQPSGAVTVKIPVPENMDGNACKVYRQETDGTYTDMNAVYQNGYMVFTTDHFSVYVLTTENLSGSDVSGDVTDTEDTTGTDSSVTDSADTSADTADTAADGDAASADGTTTTSAESGTNTGSTISPNTGASYAGLASAIGAAALSGAALLFIKKRKE